MEESTPLLNSNMPSESSIVSVDTSAAPAESHSGLAQEANIIISKASETSLDVDTIELLRVSKALCGCTERFNRPQWENMWYMYWTVALISLFPSPRAFPAPQFPIYPSSGRMMVPDFVVLYLTGRQDPVGDLDLLPFNEALTEFARDGWKVEDVAILTIIEIKSTKINVDDIGPVERVEDIPCLVSARYLALITEATFQATSQAEVFFTDPKNKDINATVVIGIINDNWSWAKIERGQVATAPSKGTVKGDNTASTSLQKKTSGPSQVHI